VSTKLRIAWFSPLRGRRGASAYATELLAAHVSQKCDVEFFHDRFESFEPYRAFHYLSCFSRAGRRDFDVYFYQVEDGIESHFTRAHLALAPGAVWFHDYMLADRGPESLRLSPWRDIVGAFAKGGELRSIRLIDAADRKPVAEREAAFAPVALFSSARDHAEFRRAAGARIRGISSAHLPFPVRPEIPASALAGRRIIYCGAPGVEDRSHKLLPAVLELGSRAELVWLIDPQERSAAEARIAEFGLGNVEIVEGRSPRRWEELTSTAAAAAHPHFSAYGRTGPYLHISLKAGLPCVITDYWGHDFYTDSVAVKVAPGDQETLGYREAIRGVLGAEGAALGRRAREFAGEYFEAPLIAAELRTVFERDADALREFGAAWRGFQSRAKGAVLEDIRESNCAGFAPRDGEGIIERACREFGWEEAR
jgi:hypothetical protein